MFMSDEEVAKTCKDVKEYLLARKEIDKVDKIFRSSKLADAFQIELWANCPSNEFRVALEEEMNIVWPTIRFAYLYFKKDETFMRGTD